MAYETVHGNESFEIAVLQRGHRGVSVVLCGELDHASAPDLRNRLARLISGGVIHIVIDLANVTFIDSTGISVFLTTLKRTEERGGSLVIRNTTPAAFRVFEITGLLDVLSVSGTDKAVKTPPPAMCKPMATPKLKSSDRMNMRAAHARRRTV